MERSRLPPPPQTVRSWPLIGNEAYKIWDLASTNLRALLTQAAPYLKPVGGTLLGAAGSLGINLLKFIAATIVYRRSFRRDGPRRLTWSYRNRSYSGIACRHWPDRRRCSGSGRNQLFGAF